MTQIIGVLKKPVKPLELVIFLIYTQIVLAQTRGTFILHFKC